MKFDIPINRTDTIVLIILFVIFILGLRILVSFFRKDEPEGQIPTTNASLRGPCQVTLRINGMMCGMCETHVKEAIRKSVPKASHLVARHTKGTASFWLECAVEEQDLRERLQTAFSPMGYHLTSVTMTKRRTKRFCNR